MNKDRNQRLFSRASAKVAKAAKVPPFHLRDGFVAEAAKQVASLCEAIRKEAKGEVIPCVTSAEQVDGPLAAMLLAIHHIGLMMHALGGHPLAHLVILAVDELLDDENVEVFLNRRWDGYPREGPRLVIGGAYP